jgi:hypothetical protein
MLNMLFNRLLILLITHCNHVLLQDVYIVNWRKERLNRHLTLQNNSTSDGDMAQVVEHLLTEGEALSSTPSTKITTKILLYYSYLRHPPLCLCGKLLLLNIPLFSSLDALPIDKHSCIKSWTRAVVKWQSSCLTWTSPWVWSSTPRSQSINKPNQSIKPTLNLLLIVTSFSFY